MKLFKAIILFLFLGLHHVNAQKLNLQKISIKDGLSQSTVRQIEKDDFGNLWLATGYGLSKYNGKTFEVFTTSDGMPTNEITNLLYYKTNLFIGTKKGLCLFDGAKINYNPLLQKIKGNVKKIIPHNNIVHIITTRGYYLLDNSNSEFKLDSIAIPSILGQNPTDAEFDEDGNLWISTSKHGIYFIENNISTKIQKFNLIQNASSSTTINKKLTRIANFNSTNLLKGNAVMSIEFDANKNLLVSDWGNGIALLKFDLSNSVFNAEYIVFDSLVTNNLNVLRYTNIQRDNANSIYLATDGSGFLKIPLDQNTNENNYKAKDLKIIYSDNGFFGNNPLCFLKDEFENLWVGTLNDGLILISENSSLSYKQKDGLEEEKVISIYNTSDSAIWLGTYGGGAFKFKNKKFTRSFWDQGISESIIKSIIEDDFGNVWLGTSGGGISIISKENSKKELQVSKVISEINDLQSNFVNYLYKSKNGAIWVGYQSQKTIDRIVLNKDLTYTITHFPITNLNTLNVTCLLEDDEHDIWITSNEGVWKLKTISGKVDNDLSTYKNILCASKDWNGNIWLGSSDVGIIILKNKLRSRYFDNNALTEFEKINTTNGLNSNNINTILFSKDKVWIVTNNGINEIKIDTYLSKIIDIKSLSVGQAFASYDNKPNSSILDKENNLYIGSVDGLTAYNTANSNNEVKKTRIPFEIFINKILIENKIIDWTNPANFSAGEYSNFKFNEFFNWYKIPKNLELDYTHNTIQLILNTNSISNQKQINYTYKLIGYDKKWNIVFNSNEITYRNLPAGDYILVLKASLSNDFSKSKEFSYQFTIKPPFWQSTLFYIVITILILMILYYLIFTRETRMKREKLKLELIVKARTADIEKKSIEIELQNTLIQGINKDLTDSIKYAQRIQQTILPDTNLLNNYFSANFVFYKPRNIVSGDYYWIKEIDGLIYIAVVDCTGHGVPGAFMSLISSNILNEAVDLNLTLHNPVAIIEHLRKQIKLKLTTNNNDQINDGLDISLICFNKEKQIIEYVNANRPLYIISNNELTTIPSENISIGGFADFKKDIPSKTISVKKGDQLFLFTDGITDQFGGIKNKKYNPTRLRQFLLLNNHLPLPQLNAKLENEITEWKGSYDQTDDILLIGLTI